MSLAEKIIEKVKSLPDDKQSEILDFIDSLSKKVKEEEKKSGISFLLNRQRVISAFLMRAKFFND